MILATLLLIAHAHGFTFDKEQMSVAVVIDQLRSEKDTGYQLELLEPIPADAKSDFKIKDQPFERAIQMVEAQSPIRLARHPDNETREGVKRIFVSWSGNPPPKGHVRLFQLSGSYQLEATEADVASIIGTVKRVTGHDAREDFSKAGVPMDKKLASYKSGPRKTTPPSDETGKEFAMRLLPELGKPDAQPPTTRMNWNLTFLPGNPPDPGTSGKIDFAASGPHVTAAVLASAITAAYASKAPVKQGEVGPKPDLVASAVGNTSLVLEGRADLVNEVRRMLATQIDVPQSQIVLELDAYQVSANVKGRDGADRTIRELTLAQEIARAYKRAHYTAIQETLLEMGGSIGTTIRNRAEYGLPTCDLFKKAGMPDSTMAKLSLSEVLAFLGYADGECLRKTYPRKVRERFTAVRESVCERILKPLQKADEEFKRAKEEGAFRSDYELLNAMAQRNGILAMEKELRRLNDQLARAEPLLDANKESSATRSALLASVAAPNDGGVEDKVTRGSLEEFLILWLATANPTIFSKLEEAGSMPTKEQSVNAFGGAGIDSKFPAQTSSEERVAALERLKELLTGDRTAKLTRASARLDTLMAEGVYGIHEDSANLVDRPLQAWIDSNITDRWHDSRFGVRYGGTTRLTVTSRSPGRMGSEAESFFPSQTVTELSLASLIPALSRTPQAPGATATDATSQLLRGGMSPIEAAALQAVFDQASKPPYDRKLGTGLHFSVLPTMLGSGSVARLQVKLNLSVDPGVGGANAGGARAAGVPGPVDLIKSSVVETELLASAFDITQVSSLRIDVGAPAKRDWEFPVLSQILPIRSWFVGPTQDKTVRHEAIILVKVTIVPGAMDLASRSLDNGK